MSARAVVLVAVLLLAPRLAPQTARGIGAESRVGQPVVGRSHAEADGSSDTLATGRSASQSEVRLVPIGRAGGMAWSVATDGNLVHVGSVHDGGPRLATWDVTDPATPLLRGVSELQPGRIEAVAIDGDVAYLAEGGSDGSWSTPWTYSGLVTVDRGLGPCRRPGAALPLAEAFVTDMAVADGNAYVTESFGHVGVYSLADPFAPLPAWTWRNWFGGTSGGYRGDGCVAVTGSTLLVGYGDRLFVVEPAGPSRAPATVGSIAAPPGHIREIAVDGPLAYVAGWPGWLWIVDVSVPRLPLEVGRIATPMLDLTSVGVSGGVAIAAGQRLRPGQDWGQPTASGPGRIVAFDVADPARPRVAASLDVTGTPLDLTLVEDLACIAAGSAGLVLLRVEVALPGPRPTARPSASPAPRRTTAWLPFASARSGLPRGGTAPVHGFRQEGGAVTALAASGGRLHVGDRLYAGIGSRLAVLEVDAANTPAVVGSSALLPRAIIDVAIVGDYAYALAGDRALATISLADPAAPELIDLRPLASPSRRLAADGDVLGIAQGAAGLRLYDLSDPAAPRPAGRAALGGRVDDVAVVAGHAFVADARVGVRVVDVRDPGRPTEVATSRLLAPDAEEFNSASIALDGTRLAFAASFAIDIAGTVAVLDVSRPDAPVLLGEAATSGRSGRGVAVAGAVLVSWSGAELVRVDVSDPSRPLQVGAGRLPVSPWVTAYGDDVAVLPAPPAPGGEQRPDRWPAWVADGVEGLRLVDLAGPAAPAVLGSLEAPAVGAVTTGGGLALAAFAGSDLAVYGAAEAGGSRRLLARVPLGRPIAAIVAPDDGPVAHVALGAATPSGGGALAAIDLTDPAAPRVLARFESSWLVLDAAVASRHAYLAEPGGVRVVTLGTGSLPPRDVTRIVLQHPTALAIEGGRLHVLTRYSGLFTYDLSQPAAPRLAGFVATPGTGLLVTGGTAWVAVGDVADGAPGMARVLHAVDVSEPRTPHLLASLDLAVERLAAPPGTAEIWVAGRELSRWDVSAPDRPRLLGRWPLPQATAGLAAERDRVWVGAGTAGLLTLEPGPSGP